jgi:hypothetical protein
MRNLAFMPSTPLAAAAVSPTFAAPGIRPAADDPAKISDPTKLYPKPPFKSQPQSWPGLQNFEASF